MKFLLGAALRAAPNKNFIAQISNAALDRELIQVPRLVYKRIPMVAAVQVIEWSHLGSGGVQG